MNQEASHDSNYVQLMRHDQQSWTLRSNLTFVINTRQPTVRSLVCIGKFGCLFNRIDSCIGQSIRWCSILCTLLRWQLTPRRWAVRSCRPLIASPWFVSITLDADHLCLFSILLCIAIFGNCNCNRNCFHFLLCIASDGNKFAWHLISNR